MAKNETVRIRPSPRKIGTLSQLSRTPPANSNYTVAKIQTAQDAMVATRDMEAQKQADLDTARDDATAAEWAFHNAVLGAKDQVKAQFGDNSNELQGLGLKKKSEYKSPSPKAKKPATP